MLFTLRDQIIYNNELSSAQQAERELYGSKKIWSNIRKKLFRIIENIDWRDRNTYDDSIRKITTLYCFDQSVFVCSRSFYLLVNERCFLIQYKCCIDTRFSKCSSQQFAGFTVCEKFPSLLHYLSLSILSIHRSILRSCDRKFVFRF